MITAAEAKQRREAKKLKKYIQTPHGMFTSAAKAAALLGYDPRTVRKYLNDKFHVEWYNVTSVTEKVRVRKRDVNKVTSLPDRTKPTHSRKPKLGVKLKAVQTPHGLFKSARDAAEQLGITYDTVIYRVSKASLRGCFRDWYFVSLDKNLDPSHAYGAKVQEEEARWDELLFAEGCWLVSAHNIWGDRASVTYDFKHKTYQITCREWMNGVRPHKETT